MNVRIWDMDVGCGLIALVPSTKWGNKLGLALCWHDLFRLSANGDDLSEIVHRGDQELVHIEY